jgi:Icc-related predicted phosphoesterase
LPKSITTNKTIFISHCPPAGVGLDLVENGFAGSKVISQYILDKQPLLSLHGHIHESPNRSGKWFNYIDKTLCIQPGQTRYRLDGIVIELDELNIVSYQKYKWQLWI